MKIELDEIQLAEVVRSTITEGVGNALNSRHVKDQIARTLGNEVATGAVAMAIKQAVGSLDITTLTSTLAQQISRTVTAATVVLLRDSFTDVIARLRGLKDYQKDYEFQIKKIRQELQL